MTNQPETFEETMIKWSECTSKTDELLVLKGIAKTNFKNNPTAANHQLLIDSRKNYNPYLKYRGVLENRLLTNDDSPIYGN